MKYREIIELIEQDGWRLVHTVGSHQQYKHPVKLAESPLQASSVKMYPKVRGRVFCGKQV